MYARAYSAAGTRIPRCVQAANCSCFLPAKARAAARKPPDQLRDQDGVERQLAHRKPDRHPTHVQGIGRPQIPHPGDFEITPANLKQVHDRISPRSGLLVAMADGSVHALPPSIALASFVALATANGGEVVDMSWRYGR